MPGKQKQHHRGAMDSSRRAEDQMGSRQGAAQLAVQLLLQLWPHDTPQAALRRELATLLLEDPDHRLRLSHLDALLQQRLKGAFSSSQLHLALADPKCARLFELDWAGEGEGRCRIVRINATEVHKAVQGSAQAVHKQQAVQSSATGAAAAAAVQQMVARQGQSPGANGSRLAAAAPARLQVPQQQDESAAVCAGHTALDPVASTPHMPFLGASTPGSCASYGAGSPGVHTPGTHTRLRSANSTAARSGAEQGAVTAAPAETAALDGCELGAKEAELSRRIRATWPNAEVDDDEYLASAIALLLTLNPEAQAKLPPYCKHLSDLADSLVHSHDARMAAICARSGVAAVVSKGSLKRQGLGEFVLQPRFRRYFGVQDIMVRKGEKLLVLLTDALASADSSLATSCSNTTQDTSTGQQRSNGAETAHAAAQDQLPWFLVQGGGLQLGDMGGSSTGTALGLSDGAAGQPWRDRTGISTDADTSQLMTSPSAACPASVVGFDVGVGAAAQAAVPSGSAVLPAVALQGSSGAAGVSGSSATRHSAPSNTAGSDAGMNTVGMADLAGAGGSSSGFMSSLSLFGDEHILTAPMSMEGAVALGGSAHTLAASPRGFSPLASGFGLADVLGSSGNSHSMGRHGNSAVFGSNGTQLGSNGVQPAASELLFQQRSSGAFQHNRSHPPAMNHQFGTAALAGAIGSARQFETPLQAALAAASAAPGVSSGSVPTEIASCWNGNGDSLFGQAVDRSGDMVQSGLLQQSLQRTPRGSSGSDIPFAIDGAGSSQALDAAEGSAATLLAESVLLEIDRESSDFQVASSYGSERSSSFFASNSYKEARLLQPQQVQRQQMPFLAPYADYGPAPAVLGVIGQPLPVAAPMQPDPAIGHAVQQPLSMPQQQQQQQQQQQEQEQVEASCADAANPAGVPASAAVQELAARAGVVEASHNMHEVTPAPAPPPPPPDPAVAVDMAAGASWSMPTEPDAPAPPPPPPPEPEPAAAPTSPLPTANPTAAPTGIAAAAEPASVASAASPTPIPKQIVALAAEELDTSKLSGTPPRLTGWASIAARDPKPGSAGPAPGTRSAPAPKEYGTPNSLVNGKHAGSYSTPQTARYASSTPADPVKVLARLPPRVKAEVESIVEHFDGILKLEDFDEGVVAQLNSKRTEDAAIAAVRHIANYDIASIQHMAAYINHIIKHFNGASEPGSTPTGGASSIGAYGGQIRLASVPVSAKAMLAKLPLRVYRRLEEVVGSCSYLEWGHFDAGVVKVLSQLSKIAEEDVFLELDLLATTDLSNVQYVPAWLNKRLNNRLWSRRKAEQ